MMIFGVWLTIVCSAPPPAWLLRITRAALQTKRPRCSVYPRARLSAPVHTPFIGSGLAELCKQGRQPEMNIQTPDLSAFIRQLRAFGMIFSLHLKKMCKTASGWSRYHHSLVRFEALFTGCFSTSAWRFQHVLLLVLCCAIWSLCLIQIH